MTTRRSFASIEQLEELPRELGWPVEYRQLEPGTFSSTFADLEGDSWFLIEEQSNRIIEVVGEGPTGMFVLALVEGPSAVINGQSLTSNFVFIQSPGSDFRAALPAGIKITQVGIATERFEEMVRAAAPEIMVPKGSVALFAAPPRQLAPTRRALSETLLSSSNRLAAHDEAVSRILTEIVRIAGDHDIGPVHRTLHRAGARQVLRRAREYIEAHLGETIRVASICAYAKTSLRTLERLFVRDVGIPPKQYVTARRLNAARRRLLAAKAEQNLRVEGVARSYGFTHMGRFAVDYRHQFGELPRETLRHH